MKASKFKSILKTVATITLTALTTLAVSCQPAAAKEDFSDGSYVYQPTISNSINGKYYPLTGIVTSVTPNADSRTDIITFICSNGNMFSFSAPATDCWDKADIISCIMDNNGTGNTVYDDKVMSALYSGSTKQLNNQYRSITRKGSK